jgi:nucleoside triphosphate diphosphatase
MQYEQFQALEEKVKQELARQDQAGWLAQQNWDSIANFTQEEVYELLDAIARRDYVAIKDELADLCFHLLIYAQLAEREGHFDLEAIAAAALEKLAHRSVDVGDVDSAEQAHKIWQQRKLGKKTQHGGSLFDDLPGNLPAMLMAMKLQKIAASMNFVFADAAQARSKLAEELAELDEVVKGEDQAAIEHELGDVLFACLTLASMKGINSEHALRQANRRFEKRIRAVESHIEAKHLDRFALSTEELLEIWSSIKQNET